MKHNGLRRAAPVVAAVVGAFMFAGVAHANDDRQAEAVSNLAESAAERIDRYGGGILLQPGYMSFGRVVNDAQWQTSAWGGHVDLLLAFNSPVGVLFSGGAYVPTYVAYTPPAGGQGRAAGGKPEDASLSAAIAALGPALYVGGAEETRLVIGLVVHWSTVPHGAENSTTWGGGVQLIGLLPIGDAVMFNAGVRGHVDLTSLSHYDSHSISFSWGASAGVGLSL